MIILRPEPPNLVSSEAFCKDINAVLEVAFEEISPKADLEDQLMSIASRLYHFYASQPELSKTYLKNVAFIEGEAKSVVSELDGRFLTGVLSLVEKAKANGEVREDVDALVLSSGFFSHYLTTIGFAFFNSDVFIPEHALDLLRQLLNMQLNGVRPI